MGPESRPYTLRMFEESEPVRTEECRIGKLLLKANLRIFLCLLMIWMRNHASLDWWARSSLWFRLRQDGLHVSILNLRTLRIRWRKSNRTPTRMLLGSDSISCQDLPDSIIVGKILPKQVVTTEAGWSNHKTDWSSRSLDWASQRQLQKWGLGCQYRPCTHALRAIFSDSES